MESKSPAATRLYTPPRVAAQGGVNIKINLASIIILLQAVLALLSNPTSANNPQIQALASQAITMASEALAQPSSTPLGEVPTSTITFQVSPAPIVVVPVQPQPSVDAQLGATPDPTCTLTATEQNDGNLTPVITWSDTNSGNLYSGINWNFATHLVANQATTRVVGLSLGYKAVFDDGAVCYAFFTRDQIGQTNASPLPVPGSVSTPNNIYGF